MFNDDSIKYTYNWDKFIPSDEYYENYLLKFCPLGDEALLNVKRYQVEVIQGIITIEQWKTILYNGLKRYKSICPNLNYVEVLNESRLPQFGNLSDDEYYKFYKASYEIVNKINYLLDESNKIKIGGPAPHGVSLLDLKYSAENFQISNKSQQLYNFLLNYKSDSSSQKKLDFVSFDP